MNKIRHIMTPSGPVVVIAPIAQKLLTEGVISGSMTGTLHAGDAATVKAAIMAGGVCDFCTVPGVVQVWPVPDFDMPHGAGKSTDGWASCEECDALIRARKKQALLARSTAGMAFPKFSKGAIEELHGKFWRGLEQVSDAVLIALRLKQFIDNTLPDGMRVTVLDRNKRHEAIVRATGLTEAEVDLITRGDFAEAAFDLGGAPVASVSTDEQTPPTPDHIPMSVLLKLHAWRKNWGKTDPDILAWMGIQKPAAPHQIPHWQQALDAKFAAAALLRRLIAAGEAAHVFPDATDLGNAEAVQKVVKAAAARTELRNLGFGQDLMLLPLAQAYSFNGETAAAIQEAATSIPHDAPLSSIETPNTGAGWFWFGEPLAVASSPLASDKTHALLWAWVEMPVNKYPAGTPVETVQSAMAQGPRPALAFSAYVRDDNGSVDPGQMLPSTRWFWPFHLTFHEMLAYNVRDWRRTYGPGGPMEHSPHIMTEQETMVAITEISLFFVMSCLWFRQTVPGSQKKADPVLTQADGHIERHARKRYQREHKLGDTPTVRVVALRKSVRVDAAEAPEERAPGARNYHCRWIVKGHARLQACGPGRKDRKLIWIDAFIKGPDDKPVQTKTTVYAVVR